VKLCKEPSVVSHQPSGTPAHAQLLEAMCVDTEVVRSRMERKPMQSVKTNFMTQTLQVG